MRVDLFDFDLPDDSIALRPAQPRDSARMLMVDPGALPSLRDAQVRDLAAMLAPGDALVFNDTKVIPAQLEGVRSRPGPDGQDVETAVSATLHMREAADSWRAFMRPGKRIKIGDRVSFGQAPTRSDVACLAGVLDATVMDKGEGGEVVLRFDLSGPALDAAILAHGHIPLPPYIASKRPEDARDRADYQTIYAREDGAVAAPTAGLHFTQRLLDDLQAAGIERHFVTLHVGAGTFLPVKADDTDAHRMHSEIGTVSAETAAALQAVKAEGRLSPWSGPTDIFITPGYRFRFVDLLMTNFHLPKSTLFMLVSAFCGLETMRAAYDHAIRTGYRFYSYGDSSLLTKARS
jgi:S-adenosylmethionine:tRNA ribosyltransferase-isomerase